MHGDPTYLNAAPIRATSVKRAYGPGPVTTRAAGLGCLFFWILPRSCPGLLAARPGSGWSARSRAAARTNELDAGKRPKITGSGEGGRLRFGLCGVACGFRCVAGGVVSQAPIRRRASVRGGCHDHVSGNRAAQSDDRARRWRRLMPKGERARGLTTLPSSRPPRRLVRAGGLHVGQQVPGAGQQLAGDRDGGDLLPAALGDGRVGGSGAGSARGAAGRSPGRSTPRAAGPRAATAPGSPRRPLSFFSRAEAIALHRSGCTRCASKP